MQTYETENNTVLFSLDPVEAPRVLWLDLSCQEAAVFATLPSVTIASQPRSLDLHSKASINVNLRDSEGVRIFI